MVITVVAVMILIEVDGSLSDLVAVEEAVDLMVVSMAAASAEAVLVEAAPQADGDSPYFFRI